MSMAVRLNVIGQSAYEDGGMLKKSLYHFMIFFDLNQENNIPTLFSTLLLGSISVLLVLICKSEKNKFLKLNWRLLSLIFLFLCFDEFLSIHEMLIGPVGKALDTSGLLFFAWVIPYGILVLLLFFVFLRFLLKLPRKIGIMFITAGFIYVFGALIMELPEGWIAEKYGVDTFWFLIIVIVEEILEMLGLIYFIYALLTYMSLTLRIDIRDDFTKTAA